MTLALPSAAELTALEVELIRSAQDANPTRDAGEAEDAVRSALNGIRTAQAYAITVTPRPAVLVVSATAPLKYPLA